MHFQNALYSNYNAHYRIRNFKAEEIHEDSTNVHIRTRTCFQDIQDKPQLSSLFIIGQKKGQNRVGNKDFSLHAYSWLKTLVHPRPKLMIDQFNTYLSFNRETAAFFFGVLIRIAIICLTCNYQCIKERERVEQ